MDIKFELIGYIRS